MSSSPPFVLKQQSFNCNFALYFYFLTAIDPMKHTGHTAPADLTQRQWEILGLIAKGLSNRDISELLNISFHTVKNHAANILEQLDASNRTEATLIFNQLNTGTDCKPTIAVLPFRHNAEDFDRHIIEGFCADLVFQISLWRWIPVISAQSACCYLNSYTPFNVIGAELGAQLLVAGSINLMQDNLQINAEVVDSNSQQIRWSKSITCPYDNFLVAHKDIAKGIIAECFPEIHAQLITSECQQPKRQLQSWHYACKGFSALKQLTQAANKEAEQHFKQALQQDKTDAMAHYGMTECLYQRLFNQWHSGTEQLPLLLWNAARQCQEVAPKSCHTQLAVALAHIGSGEIQEATLALESAIDLNPNFASAHSLLGQLVMMLGDPNNGICHLKTALKLSPRDPRLWSFHLGLSLAYFALEQYEPASTHALLALQDNPKAPTAYATLAASYGQQGYQTQAKKALKRLSEVDPRYSLTNFNLILVNANPEYLQRYADGLRLAGMTRQ